MCCTNVFWHFALSFPGSRLIVISHRETPHTESESGKSEVRYSAVSLKTLTKANRILKPDSAMKYQPRCVSNRFSRFHEALLNQCRQLIHDPVILKLVEQDVRRSVGDGRYKSWKAIPRPYV